MTIRYKSQVLYMPPAEPAEAHEHFSAKLRVETDPSDVHHDMEHGIAEFVLIDARSEKHYREEHIPGAVSLPYAQITEKHMAEHYSPDTLFVTYCWSPACNASTKAAVRLSALGYAVKEMIGGIEYWKSEGYDTVKGEG